MLRIKPDGPAMFRDYDLHREYQVLAALAAGGGPPVPGLIGIDEAGNLLGRPMFAMHFVTGRIPSDDKPGFAEAGWLFEATHAQQREFCVSLVQAIAKIHEVDWRARGLDALQTTGPPLEEMLGNLHGLHRWGAGAELHPSIEAGFAALQHDLPRTTATHLLWGDARPANVIERDFAVATLLDWELASLGPRECDIAWLLEMNRMRTTGSGVAPLPGFLSDAEMAAEYQRASGVALDDLRWHLLFAVVKMAVLMERHLRVAIARGHLRAGHRLLNDNVSLRRLNELLAEN